MPVGGVVGTGIVGRTHFSAEVDDPKGLGRRHNAFTAFIEPFIAARGDAAVDAARLTVLSQTLVRKVVLEENGGKSVGVQKQQQVPGWKSFHAIFDNSS